MAFQQQAAKTNTQTEPITHLLGVGLIISIVPLLRPLGGDRDVPGRLAELLGRRLGRHC